MKTIGLIGGLSWESSLEYYRLINEAVKQRLGGLHSAQCVMYSLDFGPIEELQRQGDWQGLTGVMVDAARRVKNAGADFVLICSNTMHKTADAVQAAVNIPVLHIADAAAAAIKQQRVNKVGLLGTRFVMEEAFYKQRLQEQHGIEVLVPERTAQEIINDVIFKELCVGSLNPASRHKLKAIINELISRESEGIILGCTEIPLLIKQADADIPVFDTMTLHVNAAVEHALG